jgi:hypothetical protein
MVSMNVWELRIAAADLLAAGPRTEFDVARADAVLRLVAEYLTDCANRAPDQSPSGRMRALCDAVDEMDDVLPPRVGVQVV